MPRAPRSFGPARRAGLAVGAILAISGCRRPQGRAGRFDAVRCNDGRHVRHRAAQHDACRGDRPVRKCRGPVGPDRARRHGERAGGRSGDPRRGARATRHRRPRGKPAARPRDGGERQGEYVAQHVSRKPEHRAGRRLASLRADRGDPRRRPTCSATRPTSTATSSCMRTATSRNSSSRSSRRRSATTSRRCSRRARRWPSAQSTVQANGSNLGQSGLQQSSVAQSQATEAVALAQAQQVRV